MANIENKIDEIIADIGLEPNTQSRKLLCSRNMEMFGYYYFPHIISKPNNKFHRWLYKKSFDILTKPEHRSGIKLAVASPRGYAKSSLLSFILPLWCICFNKKKYIILISETQGQAEDFLEDVKSELISNQKLGEDFPHIFGKSDIRWRQDDIVLKNEVRIRAIGCGGKIRGRKHRGIRPDLILLDDIEGRESVESDTVRLKLWNQWFLKEVMKAGAIDGSTDFISLGTILHEDSILSKLLDHNISPDWEKKKFQAVESFATNQHLWDVWKEIYLTHEDEEAAAEEAWKFYKKNEEAMLEGAEVLWPEGESYYDLMVMCLTPEGESAFNCFRCGTSVLLADYSHKNVDELKIGDSILSGDGSSQKVTDVVERYTDSDLYSIKVAGAHKKLEVTEDHPFLVWPKIRYKHTLLGHQHLFRELSINKTEYRKNTIKDRIFNNTFIWKFAKDLEVGDAVVQPIPKHVKKDHRCDTDWWWFVGYYLAEGCLNYSNFVTSFVSHTDERFLLEKTIDICKNLGYGNAYNIHDPSNGEYKTLSLTVCSKPLFDELKRYGRFAHGKFLPAFVDDICYDCFLSLWKGYISGDGFLISRNEISYEAVNSVSERLLLDFQRLWLKFGYVSYTYNSRKAGVGEIRGRMHKSRQLYSLQLVGKPTSGYGRVLQSWIYKDKLYSRIQQTKKINEVSDKKVYGVSVSGNKTYCVPKAIVHNSEKQNDPIDITRVEIRPEDIKTFTIETFNRESIIRLEEEEREHPSLLRKYDNLTFFGAWDPSKGKKAKVGDYSAIVTIGKDRNGLIYIVDVDLKRKDVDSRIEDILRLHNKYNYRMFVVETAAFQYFAKDVLVKRAKAKGSDLVYRIKEDTGLTDKDLRIRGLAPYVVDGTLRFLHSSQWGGTKGIEYREAIKQLVGYGAGAKHDDFPDCLAMVFELVKYGIFRRKALINGKTVVIGR